MTDQSERRAIAVGLLDSDHVGPWEPGIRNLCNPEPPEPCDCGFVGLWERRWVWVWHDSPGYRRGDKACRRDLAEGRPPRPDDEGWWIMGGFDERCPGCGDVERFTHDADLIAQRAEHAAVIPFGRPRSGRGTDA